MSPRAAAVSAVLAGRDVAAFAEAAESQRGALRVAGGAVVEVAGALTELVVSGHREAREVGRLCLRRYAAVCEVLAALT